MDQGAMVGVTKIGLRNANYWINAVAEGGEDYYTKPGEAQGQWRGELAAELDLLGEVDHDAYAAVFAGKHPGTGDVLVDPLAALVLTLAALVPLPFFHERERNALAMLGRGVRRALPRSERGQSSTGCLTTQM